MKAMTGAYFASESAVDKDSCFSLSLLFCQGQGKCTVVYIEATKVTTFAMSHQQISIVFSCESNLITVRQCKAGLALSGITHKSHTTHTDLWQVTK